jgi:pimeloyl-ACP methyl ester carboxylesterase
MAALGYSLEGFTRHHSRVNGIDHIWWEIGEGAPCLYFHGGGTFHGFDWARDRAGDFRMILPHHPGFGESGDADFRSIGDYAAHYRAFMDVIGVDRCHLVGASMGGYLAATFAARNPTCVDRLILVAPAGLQSERAPIPDFAAIPPDQHRALFAADLDWIEPYWPAVPEAPWLALRMREAQAAMRARGEPAESHAALMRDLAVLSAPTLLLWGSLDRVLPLPTLELWQEALPFAQSVVIPGGSHLLLDEFPAARLATLDFLTA